VPVPDNATIETASWARRILALTVDWFACTLVVVALIGPRAWSEDPMSSWYVLGLFVAESAVFTAVAGGSFGKLATRLRVVRNDGSYGPVSLLRCVLRQVLVALVVPPLVFRPDGRGLHDLAAGSRTARLEDLRRG
jgi:uncharacterized RDD family membrane protein YckC